MEDALWLRKKLGIKSGAMRYGFHRKNGREIAVSVSDRDVDSVHVHLKRKIESEDVSNGKLISLVRQEVVRRGGKRATDLALSYQAAKDLHTALGKALKDVEKRRFLKRFLDGITIMIFTVSRIHTGILRIEEKIAKIQRVLPK